MRLLAAVALVFVVRCVSAQQPALPSEPNWEHVCKAALAKPLSAQQPAGPLTASDLPKCDEQALYYGPSGKPDYVAALQCGWWQRAHPRPSYGGMFYGPGVLTMLYANGQGVPRDYSLAIRFACENTWAAPAEMDGRIGHLEQLQKNPSQDKSFDLCDDGTSGLTMGACQAVASARLKAIRDRRAQAQVVSLPPAAKSALSALQAAEQAFEQSRTRKEVDLSGTGYSAFRQREEDKLSDQFLINLQRFAKGDIPAASAAEVARLDGSLNATYQRLQHMPPDAHLYGGAVKPEGIRDTQRAWLKLMDAWVAFARVAYPKLSETSLRAELIHLRLHQLQSLLPQE